MNDITVSTLFEWFRCSTISRFGDDFTFNRRGRSFYARSTVNNCVMRSSANYCMITYVAYKVSGDMITNQDKALAMIDKMLDRDCYDAFYVNRYEDQLEVMLKECNEAIDIAMNDFEGTIS